MNKACILGVDQGTTGTRVLALDDKWNLSGNGYCEHHQIYPKQGWVEHDPFEIWEQTRKATMACLEESGLTKRQVRAIGIDNQGETVLIWDKVTGRPVYNAIVWMDRRTAADADLLRESWGESIREKTGLAADAYFSALKIRWILDKVEGVREQAERGELLAGTTDTWLIWNMTGRQTHVTDYSTASRTMLLNIHTGEWDREILDRLAIPHSILPEIMDSNTLYGETDPASFIGIKAPITGGAVDQHAALFGQACFAPGMVKTTYGTGCFMLMNMGDTIVNSENRLLTTIAWSLNGKKTFALDGGVYIAGAAVQWLRDGIKIIKSAEETEILAKSVPNTGGLYFVPAFVGLAAPYWDQYARGTMVGITGNITCEHIVRATLESIAFQVAENLKVMQEDSGICVPLMRADGGASVNSFLMQFQADILGIPVDVPLINETTALGAAYLAGLGAGDFTDLDEIAAKWKVSRRYEPCMSPDERGEKMYKWRRAIQRAMAWEQN